MWYCYSCSLPINLTETFSIRSSFIWIFTSFLSLLNHQIKISNRRIKRTPNKRFVLLKPRKSEVEATVNQEHCELRLIYFTVGPTAQNNLITYALIVSRSFFKLFFYFVYESSCPSFLRTSLSNIRATTFICQIK